jgi:hypothetical protein
MKCTDDHDFRQLRDKKGNPASICKGYYLLYCSKCGETTSCPKLYNLKIEV